MAAISTHNGMPLKIKAHEQYRDQPGDQRCSPFVREDANVKYPFLKACIGSVSRSVSRSTEQQQ